MAGIKTSVPDYLKHIYNLSQVQVPVSTSSIAHAMEVSNPSVSDMLVRLHDRSLVDRIPYRGVVLTDSGEKQALRLIRRHRLWEVFLVKFMKFNGEDVHDQAEKLEHVTDQRLEDRLAALLDDPAEDPHGAPIPTENGEITEHPLATLSDLAPGEQAVIHRWVDYSPDLAAYLESKGLVPGAPVRLEEVEPFGGPYVVRVGEVRQFISVAVAGNILVRKGAGSGDVQHPPAGGGSA